jgi:hypothetical protein
MHLFIPNTKYTRSLFGDFGDFGYTRYYDKVPATTLDRDWPNRTALISLASYLATKNLKLVRYKLAHRNFIACIACSNQ